MVKKMDPMLIDKPKEEFTSLELSVALKNKDNDAVYLESNRPGRTIIHRIKKKIFVCTGCRSYITAHQRVQQKAGRGHSLEDLKEERMKRDRRYRERQRRR